MFAYVGGNQTLFVHCQFGQGRTGLVIALHRVFDECWTPEDARAEWRAVQGLWHRILQGELTRFFWSVTKDPVRRSLFAAELAILAHPHRENPL